ncbi:hypothetical protein CYMTET_7286 [Cymbomonas tetramitiformis]|uniref:Uncharacterized protein n=1 Tax=Cymbomonas tetramitiformis TaxID=36881 RepID=A0AAE0LH61_9CHLO|nr:hypothetical protein CYMTET_7286 [Cymbomonas tetramitiformis]
MEGAAAVAKEVGEEVEVEVAKGMAEVAGGDGVDRGGGEGARRGTVGKEMGGRSGGGGGGHGETGLGVARWWRGWRKEEGRREGGGECGGKGEVKKVVEEKVSGFELLANYWAPYLGYLTNPSGTYFGLMLKNLCCNGYTVDGGAVGSTVGAEVGTLVVGWVVGEEVGEAVLGVVVGSGVVGCKVVGVLDVGALVGGVDGDEVGTAVVGVVVGEVVGEAVGVAVGVEEWVRPWEVVEMAVVKGWRWRREPEKRVAEVAEEVEGGAGEGGGGRREGGEWWRRGRRRGRVEEGGGGLGGGGERGWGEVRVEGGVGLVEVEGSLVEVAELGGGGGKVVPCDLVIIP